MAYGPADRATLGSQLSNPSFQPTLVISWAGGMLTNSPGQSPNFWLKTSVALEPSLDPVMLAMSLKPVPS